MKQFEFRAQPFPLSPSIILKILGDCGTGKKRKRHCFISDDEGDDTEAECSLKRLRDTDCEEAGSKDNICKSEYSAKGSRPRKTSAVDTYDISSSEDEKQG